MSAYPASHNERLIDARALRELISVVFEACDMSPIDAMLLADSLVAADLGGVHSHGVLRVPEYVEKLRGGVNPRGVPRIASEKGGAHDRR
ncbi:MAG: Ldh family oxidoreductase [Bryobacterales bacterium]